MTVRLPLEVLTAIVKELDDVQDLYHVRMVCRTLCAVVTPIAFRSLSVITTKGSAQNLGRLFDLPDIAAHVREIAFHDNGADRRGRALKYVRANAIRELASSFSRIHRLPHIETIDLTFYPNYDNQHNFDDGSRLAVQASILDALAASCEVRVPPKLSSLSLHNLRTSDLPLLESTPFQKSLANLRCLQLTVLRHTFHGRRCNFWSTFCPRVFLNPTQQSLTELTLHSDVCIGASSGFSLTGLQFPHLTALSLRRLVFGSSVGVEDFILRHSSTLARLELLACGLPTYFDPPLPPWGPPPSDYCWDSIWDRFATELTTLVVLHVDDPDCPYHPSRRHFFFFTDEARKSHNAADAVALQRFHAVVTARSKEMRGNS